MINHYFKITTGPSLAEKIVFRVSHPIVPTLIFGITAATLIILAQINFHYSLLTLIGTLVLGVFAWTLVEYILHRFIFHWTKIREPWRTIFSGLHMDHHRDTKDQSLIIAPTTVVLINSIIILMAAFSITQSWGLSCLLLAGINLGYIFYEWVHYGSHEYNWNRGYFKYLKHYHLAHHFKHPNQLFGVTNPFWDWVFKTYVRN